MYPNVDRNLGIMSNSRLVLLLLHCVVLDRRSVLNEPSGLDIRHNTEETAQVPGISISLLYYYNFLTENLVDAGARSS